MANRATTSVDVLPDVPERYEGYESIIVPPPDSDSEESKTCSEPLQSLEDTLQVSKINEHTNIYSHFLLNSRTLLVLSVNMMCIFQRHIASESHPLSIMNILSLLTVLPLITFGGIPIPF